MPGLQVGGRTYGFWDVLSGTAGFMGFVCAWGCGGEFGGAKPEDGIPGAP